MSRLLVQLLKKQYGDRPAAAPKRKRQVKKKPAAAGKTPVRVPQRDASELVIEENVDDMTDEQVLAAVELRFPPQRAVGVAPIIKYTRETVTKQLIADKGKVLQDKVWNDLLKKFPSESWDNLLLKFEEAKKDLPTISLTEAEIDDKLREMKQFNQADIIREELKKTLARTEKAVNTAATKMRRKLRAGTNLEIELRRERVKDDLASSKKVSSSDITSNQIDEEIRRRDAAGGEVGRDDTGLAEMKAFTDVYYETIREEIARKNGLSTDDVSNIQIDEELMKRRNLPIMIFLVEFAEKLAEGISSIESMEKYANIPIQFKRLFLLLPEKLRIEFIIRFFTEYPLDNYPLGPTNKYVLDSLIKFYNIDQYKPGLARSAKNERDISLVSMSDDELRDTLKTFTLPDILIYRSIIISRLSAIGDDEQQQMIIDLYKPLLVDKNVSELALMCQGERFSSKSEESDSICSLEKKIGEEWSPVNELDLMIPSSKKAREYIADFIQTNLPSIMRVFNIVKPMTTEQVATSIELMEYFYDKLTGFFSAMIPRTGVIRDFIIEQIRAGIEALLATPTNILKVNIHAAPNAVNSMKEEIEVTRRLDKVSVSEKHLIQQAAKLGIKLGDFTAISKKMAIDKLRVDLSRDIISQDDFDDAVELIDELIKRYKELELEQKLLSRGSSDLKKKIAIANKRKIAILKGKIEAERVKSQLLPGQVLSESVLEALDESAWKEAAAEIGVSDEESAMVNIMKDKRSIGITKKHLRERLHNTIKRMPDALKQSLQDLVNNLEEELDRFNEKRPDVFEFKNQKGIIESIQIQDFYKFVKDIIVANMNAKESGDNKALADVIAVHSRGNLPLPFMDKIINMLKSDHVTGADLFAYVSTYTKHQTRILKNPLIRSSSGRRQKRYEDIAIANAAEESPISKLSKIVPTTITPFLKDCITTHVLKPWMNLSNPLSWNLWIAHPGGKYRSDMSVSEQAFFAVPYGFVVTLQLPDGKLLPFYRPTTAYWLQHCSAYHSLQDESGCQCNTDSQIRDLTLSNRDNIKFYELLLKEPVVGQKSGDQLMIYYREDIPKRLIFLSNDPETYRKECQYYKTKFAQTALDIDAIKDTPLSSSVGKKIRKEATRAVQDGLTVLRLAAGMTNENSTDDALEKALYEYAERTAPSNPMSVHWYLKNVFGVLIFLDAGDTIGKHAKFFRGLVAQSSRKFYPMLLKWFGGKQNKLPEIYYNLGVDEALKYTITEYIDHSTELMVDRLIYSLFKTSTATPVSSFFDKRVRNIGTIISKPLETKSGTGEFHLRGICKNGEEYAGMPDDSLIYYKMAQNDDIYCVSKLELSGMSAAKNYKFKDVEFDPQFVSDYAEYTNYAADEIRIRNKYLDAVKTLFQDPKYSTIFDALVQNKLLFGSVEPNDLVNVGVVKALANMPSIVLYLTSQINDVIDSYVFDKIAAAAKAFITSNKDKIKGIIEEAYAEYKKTVVDAPTSIPINVLSAVEDGKLKYENVIAPAIDAVSVFILDQFKNFPLGNKERTLIANLIDNSMSRETGGVSSKEGSIACGSCNAHIQNMSNAETFKTLIKHPDDWNWKILKFCTENCFLKYKVDEPTKSQANQLRLQGDVMFLTNSYMTYPEMVLVARDLGIKTSAMNGDIISQNELMDRIRVNLGFIPSIEHMLTDNTMRAIRSLAAAVDVAVFGTDTTQSIEYYTSRVDELRNLWKSLRGSPKFEKLLYSTITTFNPLENAGRVQQVVDKERALLPDPTLWAQIKINVVKYLRKIPDLQRATIETDDFKLIREDVLAKIKNMFPGIIPPFDQRQRKELITIKRSLQTWLQKHLDAFYQKSKLDLTGMEEEEDMFRALRRYCSSGSLNSIAVSKFTSELINSSSHPDSAVARIWIQTQNGLKQVLSGVDFFQTTFWPAFLEHYKCKNLRQVESSYNDFIFAIEKANSIVDESMAIIIHEQRPPVAAKEVFKGFVGQRKAKLKRAENAIKSKIQAVNKDTRSLLDKVELDEKDEVVLKEQHDNRTTLTDIRDDIRKRRIQLLKDERTAKKESRGIIKINESTKKQFTDALDTIMEEEKDVPNAEVDEDREFLESQRIEAANLPQEEAYSEGEEYAQDYETHAQPEELEDAESREITDYNREE